MKYMDEVRLIKDRKNYAEDNCHVGDSGIITLPEIRDGSFYVQFDTGNDDVWYKYCVVKIEDLEVIKEANLTDEEMIEDLINNDPSIWCKVEDGYIMNLLGEKKNKIPYDYKS